jgi:hypothetical protein
LARFFLATFKSLWVVWALFFSKFISWKFMKFLARFLCSKLWLI